MQFLTTSRRRALLARALPFRSRMAAGERAGSQLGQGRAGLSPQGWGARGVPKALLEESCRVCSCSLVLAPAQGPPSWGQLTGTAQPLSQEAGLPTFCSHGTLGHIAVQN